MSGGARWGNASNWAINARALGYRVDNIPAVGAIAWFTYDHVAYVDSINGDGTVNVSEYNYRLDYQFGTRNNVTPASFIHVVD